MKEAPMWRRGSAVLALCLLAACGDTDRAPGKPLDGGSGPDASQPLDGGAADASVPREGGGIVLVPFPTLDGGPPPDLDQPRDSANVFFSGHSLIDNPLPENVTSIAQGFGYPTRWNEQIILGSPLRIRTRGDNPGSGSWDGYRRGKNRQGENMNVIEELRSPRTLDGGRYDALVITENHNLLEMLFFEDTVRYLRHFHERFVAGNAQGVSYLYAPWWTLKDKRDLEAWLDYEQKALPAWECIVARINRSLEAEGRSDRLKLLPANWAMARLIERAIHGNVPGISTGNATETASRLVEDDVHLTRTGIYYMSLVTYASVYRRSPAGAWRPSEVDESTASALQSLAWEVVALYYANEQPRDLAECQAHVRDVLCQTYWSYKGEGNNVDSCRARMGKQDAMENPLYFGASDGSYWFPAP